MTTVEAIDEKLSRMKDRFLLIDAELQLRNNPKAGVKYVEGSTGKLRAEQASLQWEIQVLESRQFWGKATQAEIW